MTAQEAEFDAAKSRAFDAIARMIRMTHYPAKEVLDGIQNEIDMAVKCYQPIDFATDTPPPPQEPEGGLVAELMLLKSEYDGYDCNSAFDVCIAKAQAYDREASALRTRLETTQGALRAIRNETNETGIYKIADMALPPAPAPGGGGGDATVEGGA